MCDDVRVVYIHELHFCSKYTCTVAEATTAMEIGGHLLTLRALMGWSIGANELYICVILPHCLMESQYLVDVLVKGDDGVDRWEKHLLGMGILGSMQGFEALHALTKVLLCLYICFVIVIIGRLLFSAHSQSFYMVVGVPGGCFSNMRSSCASTPIFSSLVPSSTPPRTRQGCQLRQWTAFVASVAFELFLVVTLRLW